MVAEDPLFAHLHGICMFFAWSVLATISLVSARKRKVPGVSSNWFLIHWISSATIILLSIVGTLFGKDVHWGFFFLLSNNLFSTAFAQHDFAPLTWDWQHQIIGVCILFLAGCQGLLGLMSHLLYSPSRMSLPWIDWTHHVIGRVLYVVSIYQCWVGLGTLLEIIDNPQISLAYTAIFVLWVGASLAMLFFSDVSGFGSPQVHNYSNLQVVSDEFGHK